MLSPLYLHLVTGCLRSGTVVSGSYHLASLGPSSTGCQPPCSASSCRSCAGFVSWQTASLKWAFFSPPQSAGIDQSQPPPLSYPTQEIYTSHRFLSSTFRSKEAAIAVYYQLLWEGNYQGFLQPEERSELSRQLSNPQFMIPAHNFFPSLSYFLCGC